MLSKQKYAVSTEQDQLQSDWTCKAARRSSEDTKPQGQAPREDPFPLNARSHSCQTTGLYSYESIAGQRSSQMHAHE